VSRLSKYKLLLSLAAAVFLLDQASKIWIAATLPLGTFHPFQGAIQAIPGFFHIVHVGNTGAAFSILSEYTWLLTLIGFAALGLLVCFRRQLELSLRGNQLAYGLIVGGILGNVADRIRLGHVIDFLDFHWGGHHYPSFNVADSGITVGVAIYLYLSLATGNQKKAPNAD